MPHRRGPPLFWCDRCFVDSRRDNPEEQAAWLQIALNDADRQEGRPVADKPELLDVLYTAGAVNPENPADMGLVRYPRFRWFKYEQRGRPPQLRQIPAKGTITTICSDPSIPGQVMDFYKRKKGVTELLGQELRDFVQEQHAKNRGEDVQEPRGPGRPRKGVA